MVLIMIQNSPSMTTTLVVSEDATQCAAHITTVGAMSVPVQTYIESGSMFELEMRTRASHGYSVEFIGVPPTMNGLGMISRDEICRVRNTNAKNDEYIYL